MWFCLAKKGKIFQRESVCIWPLHCYNSVRQSLEALVKRPGFLEKCEEWWLRKIPEGVLGEVYDGQVWKDYQYVNGEPFLAAPNNLPMMLNVDWFQPFKIAPYSVGAIYYVILNLPHEDHFKEENMILVGLIPGPKKPSLTINVFLADIMACGLTLCRLVSSSAWAESNKCRHFFQNLFNFLAHCTAPQHAFTSSFEGVHVRLWTSLFILMLFIWAF